jgi:DNA-binding SARP family transcriptional activator
MTDGPLRPVPRVKVTAPSLRALDRERLLQMMGVGRERRAVLVVAQAGSGKTTLLAQFGAVSPFPVAWYRAEQDDAGEEAMVRGLAAALGGVFGAVTEPRSVDDLIATVDGWPGEGAVLIVDDLHTVDRTEGEAVIGRLLEHGPPTLRIVLASRHCPSFNLSRLRVSGDLIEIGADELRFRSWEVEHLFHDFYGERLPPDDLAELARRTEGWAAGLQLFHLATRGKPLPERRRILSELSSQTGMVREYLAQNVLDELPDDLRRFLLGSCVLGRLTGALCDELLGTTGSEKLLQRLANRQVFTVPIEGGTAFRYHEVLRSHLAGVLVSELGETAARQRHRDAGELLQRSGAVSEALWAYCRAGDWHAAAHLLGRNGGPVGTPQGRWIDAVPPGLLEQDPWLVLARARRLLELGQWSAALAAYRSAEARFPAGPGSESCGRERRALALWLEPSPNPRSDWLGLLRAATQTNPLEVAARARNLPDATGRFTEGVALLLAGRAGDARSLLEHTAARPDAGPVLGTLARLLAATAALVSTGAPDDDWNAIVEEVEAVGLAWVATLARAAADLAGGTDASAGSRAVALCDAHGDEWGPAVLVLVEAFVRLARGRPASALFEESAARSRQVNASTLERWARSGLALARAREGGSVPRPSPPAQATASGHGVPGAVMLNFLALAVRDEGQGEYYAGLARAAADACALRWPFDLSTGDTPGVVSSNGGPSPAPADGGAAAAANLRCFGGFGLRLDGASLDIRALKPRARAMLYLLAVHAGQPLHREHLVDAFWPDADPRDGIRNLQVLISTLRRLLHLGSGPGGAAEITRQGDAYRLALPSGATADTLLFEAAVDSARRARKAGDEESVIAGLDDALRLYTGDLLPEAGPADWIITDRDRYHRAAADAAQHLAEVRLSRKEPELAVEACERGLALDRYRDSFWRTLAGAYDALGDSASAARARRSYADVLDELGVSTSSN